MSQIERIRNCLLAAFSIILIVPFGYVSALRSQEYVFEQLANPFPVIDENGQQIGQPFIGGLNRPVHQFLDIDGDSDFDLFVQTQQSSLTFFRNTGSAASPDFQWEKPDWLDGLFLGNWFRFADSDADGDFDLFVEYAAASIRFYRNNGTAAIPEFSANSNTLRDSEGEFIIGDGFSIPEFADIDCDGDADLFLGRQTGFITFYENREVGSNGIPVLVFTTNTWQNIQILTGSGKSSPNANERHGANGLALADIDDDLDLDLFWGDFFAQSIVFLENKGSCTTPSFNPDSLVESFPPLEPINTGGFNMPSLVDIDGDSDKDLFVGVLGGAGSVVSDIIDNLYFYQNIGSSGNPEFFLITKRYLNNFDIGQNSAPALFDVDDDGDLDIFVANQEDLDAPDHQNSRLSFLENTGGVTTPAFRVASRDYLQQDVTRDLNYVPLFADVLGRGRADLIAGLWDGRFVFWENAGGMQFTRSNSLLQDLDVGNYSAPALADIDADGDLDFFAGKFAGTISFYENIGSATNPDFKMREEAYADIDVLRYCVPHFADINGDGDQDLFVGSLYDGIRLYINRGTPERAEFVLDSTFALPRHLRMIPALGDLDGDGDLDLVSGTTSGGLLYFENQSLFSSDLFQVEPQRLSFGPLKVGDTESATITVFNQTDAEIVIESVVLSGDQQGVFAFELSPFSLLPQGRKQLTITFRPKATGTFAASLSLSSNDGNVNVTLTGTAGELTVADGFVLHPAYPNPFDVKTTLTYEFTADETGIGQNHTLTIFNVKGQIVEERHLPTTTSQVAGEVVWDGRNRAGETVPAGIYFFRLSAGGRSSVVGRVLFIH